MLYAISRPHLTAVTFDPNLLLYICRTKNENCVKVFWGIAYDILTGNHIKILAPFA